MIALIFYVLAVVAVNWSFSVMPMVPLFGVMIPAATVLVGAIFVLRDFAQRAVGDWVLAGMLAGVLLSAWMADPMVALASGAAFAVSEMADYAVYRFTRRPFRDRVLLSSAVAVPIDSAVFLWLLPFPGAFTWQAVAAMSAVKLLAAVAVYLWPRPVTA